MRIKVLSDLHTEFGNAFMVDELFTADVDMYIIAGDLASSKNIINVLKHIDDIVDVPVLFVTGNHEYYHSTRDNVDTLIKEASFRNIIPLIEGIFEFNDTIFLGSTGWWNEGVRGVHTRGLNDFRVIYDIKENDNGRAWGRKSESFFRENLELYKDKKVICISHNMPSFECISEVFRGSQINECFANDFNYLMIDYNPLYWICGHTHDSIDMTIGNTRIVCNPYGYFKHQINPEWNDDLIIEV